MDRRHQFISVMQLLTRVGFFQNQIDLQLPERILQMKLKNRQHLWLDFEEITEEGEFYSYGIGARTYGQSGPTAVLSLRCGR